VIGAANVRGDAFDTLDGYGVEPYDLLEPLRLVEELPPRTGVTSESDDREASLTTMG
jgi:hypothetical protein